MESKVYSNFILLGKKQQKVFVCIQEIFFLIKNLCLEIGTQNYIEAIILI